MLKPFFSGDDNHHRVIRWRVNSSLLLAAEPRVNIAASVVNAANFKAPTHSVIPQGTTISSQRTDAGPDNCTRMSAIGGKADMTFCAAHVCFARNL
jgi:hypothetical protein